MEELRGGYKNAKAENIKLKDNIETQNKQCKIWLKKFEDKPEEATRNPNFEHEKQTENKSQPNPSVDDEILLIEEDDAKQNDDGEEQDDTEIILKGT
jgi:hypothetical protein